MKLCLNCNANQIRVKGFCKKCYEKKWYQDNKTERKKKEKAYYIKNKEYINKRNLAYAKRNRKKVVSYKKVWYEETREYKRERNYVSSLQRLYGLSQDDYYKLLVSQGGLCKLCSKPPKEGKRLSVDHCHKTGKVRGLLCAICNLFLGKIDKDNTLLRKLAEYG